MEVLCDAWLTEPLFLLKHFPREVFKAAYSHEGVFPSAFSGALHSSPE